MFQWRIGTPVISILSSYPARIGLFVKLVLQTISFDRVHVIISPKTKRTICLNMYSKYAMKRIILNEKLDFIYGIFA